MMLVNVDIELLRTLVYVTDMGGFTRASERLFRTQSAISLQIKKLEEVVKQKLIVRDRRGVRLTPTGQTVYKYATEILRLNDKLLTETSEVKPSIVIRIGAPDDYVQLFLSDVIRRFSSSRTDVEFQISSDFSPILSKMVDSNRLDIALVTWSVGIEAPHISDEELSWVSAPNSSLYASNEIPLAVFPQGCSVRDSALATLRNHGRKWKVAYSSNQFSPLKSAIAADCAIGVLPTNAIPPDLRAVSSDFLPRLPPAQLALKVSREPSALVRDFASSVAKIFSK